MIWNGIAFFPMLFAAIRRYHDFGKSGWRAIIFGILGKVFVLFGIMVFIIVGTIFCILNIKFLLQPSDFEENAYGKPNPFHLNHKKQK